MKKLLTGLAIFFCTISFAYAQKEDLTRADVFNFLANYYKNDVKQSYQYIDLKYWDVRKWDDVYPYLQVLVYLDLLENKSVNVYPDKEMSAFQFYKLSEKILWVKFSFSERESNLKKRVVNLSDLENVIWAVDGQKKIKIYSTNNLLGSQLSLQVNL